MDGWMDRWIDGWMDGWVGVCTSMYVRMYANIIFFCFSCSDKCNEALLSFLACDKWMSLRVEAIGSLYASCVVFISILMGLDEGKKGDPLSLLSPS